MKVRRVLAIEHDWRIRKLIRANLEPLGIEVWEAVSSRHGLQLLDEGQPDLIILDLDLPDADALNLLEALHSCAEGQVSIIALAGEPPSRRWRDAGQVDGYLQKPFAVSVLLQQVCGALDGAESVSAESASGQG